MCFQCLRVRLFPADMPALLYGSMFLYKVTAKLNQCRTEKASASKNSILINIKECLLTRENIKITHDKTCDAEKRKISHTATTL